MKPATHAVPEGFHTLAPHLIIKGAAAAIEFYKKAFGAEEVMRMPGPDGKTIWHAELRIGSSMLMLADEFPDMGCRGPQSIGGSPVVLHLYVSNVDAVVDRAVKAGAKISMPVTDMFWGDRYGKLTDPFGHEWSVATHTFDVTPEECAKAAGEAFGGHACGKS